MFIIARMLPEIQTQEFKNYSETFENIIFGYEASQSNGLLFRIPVQYFSQCFTEVQHRRQKSSVINKDFLIYYHIIKWGLTASSAELNQQDK